MNTLNALFSDSRGLLYRHATLVSGTELRTRLGSPPPVLRLRLLSDAPSITPAALGAGVHGAPPKPPTPGMVVEFPVRLNTACLKPGPVGAQWGIADHIIREAKAFYSFGMVR
ncbi:unnamed protein product [Arctogadus glacialis]